MAPRKSAVTRHLYSFAVILHRCTFWCRVIRNSGRNMPVMKAVLHFLSVRLIAGVSAVCSGYAFTHLAPTKLAVLYMPGVSVKHPVSFFTA